MHKSLCHFQFKMALIVKSTIRTLLIDFNYVGLYWIVIG